MNLPITLDPTSSEPLYKQLYNELKSAVEDGRLPANHALPPTRVLAERLGISRITVVRSYKDLINQGYLEAVTGRGTFVSQRAALITECRPSTSKGQRLHPSVLDSGLTPIAHSLVSSPFSENAPWSPPPHFAAVPPSVLPLRAWKQLTSAYLEKVSDSRPCESDSFGNMQLRSSLVSFLKRTRGLNLSPEQLVLFATPQHPARLLSQILVSPGDLVAMEEPGFSALRELFAVHGACLQAVPMDDQGIDITALRQLPPPKLLHVTPSHQDPTGRQMTIARRKELLEWAAATGTIILEDDYNNEFQYGGHAPRALQGLAREAAVIYMSSFYQVLHPLSNVAFLVLPEPLIPVFAQAKRALDPSFCHMEQSILNDFIVGGHLERHTSRARAIYARRRQCLIFTLSTNLKDIISFPSRGSGLQTSLVLNVRLSDEEVLMLAKRAGLSMTCTAMAYSGQPRRGEFLVAFTASEEDLQRAANRFAELLLQEIEKAPAAVAPSQAVPALSFIAPPTRETARSFSPEASSYSRINWGRRDGGHLS